MNYKTHKAEWTDCTKCSLSDQRSRLVFARGKIPADILLVGEAPGVSEDTLGIPFVGPAGKLLDRIIQSGIPPKVRWCITNLVCCYPRDAKETKNHEPPKEAILACGPRLAQLYTLCRPKAIIAVGGLSDKWLGKILLQEKIVQTHLVYATILHPAAILRLDVSQRSLAIRRAVATFQTVAGSVIGV